MAFNESKYISTRKHSFTSTNAVLTLYIYDFSKDDLKELKTRNELTMNFMLMTCSVLFGMNIVKARLPTATFTPEITGANCIGILCNNLKYYPEDYIRLLVSKNLNRMEKQEETTGVSDLLDEKETVGTRPVCGSKKKLVRTNGKLMVHEICINVDKPCTENNFLLNYESKCIQNYMIKKVIKLNRKTKAKKEIQIKIPSGCGCKIVNIY